VVGGLGAVADKYVGVGAVVGADQEDLLEGVVLEDLLVETHQGVPFVPVEDQILADACAAAVVAASVGSSCAVVVKHTWDQGTSCQGALVACSC